MLSIAERNDCLLVLLMVDRAGVVTDTDWRESLVSGVNSPEGGTGVYASRGRQTLDV